jgi:hypothetical protein
MSFRTTKQAKMKRRLFVLALALLPLRAQAQVPAPVPLLRPAAAPAPAPGITVVGMVQRRIPVREVRFTAFARGSADERGVLEAMRKAGIADASVGTPSGGFMQGNMAMLRGTIADVSVEKLDAIAAAAAAYVRAHPGASIDNVQFYAPSLGCAKLEVPVRLEALAEARRRGEAIAAATGVGLGEVTSVIEAGGCPGGGDGVTGPPVDASTLTATLGLSETVTYAIAPAGGARRRPL